jgi:hypothetical protein
MSFPVATPEQRRRSADIDALFARQAQQCVQEAPVKNVSLMRAKAMAGVYPLPVTHSTDVAPFHPLRQKRLVIYGAQNSVD